MKSRIGFLALVVGLHLCSGSALASGDMGCMPSWTLQQNGYDRCNNLPMLTPDNDTRTNLKLLLASDKLAALQVNPGDQWDAAVGYGKVPFNTGYAAESLFLVPPDAESTDRAEGTSDSGYGTRCSSNAGGTSAFLTALDKTEGLPDAEKQLLAEARHKLNPTCADSSDSNNPNLLSLAPAKIVSPPGKQFMQYLTAAAAFYQGRYPEALAGFHSLSGSPQPWLKEASRYMQGRVELNRAQQNAFDEYGLPDLSKVDDQALQAAEAQFKAYLQDYPQGAYAASARGLLRRVYWLANQPEQLADEYSWLMTHLEDPRNNLTLNGLVQEADNKMLLSISPEQIKNPLLLATLDLLLMQAASSSASEESTSTAPAKLSFADLEKQEPRFAERKELYQYLLAAHQFYVEKDPSAALKSLPEAVPAAMSYLDFSRLALRGLALEATQEYLAARKL